MNASPKPFEGEWAGLDSSSKSPLWGLNQCWRRFLLVAAAVLLLINLASQKGLAGEIDFFALGNFGAHQNIEHAVGVLSNVGLLVADYPITDANEDREIGSSFAGRARGNGLFYLVRAVGPQLTHGERVAFEEALPHLRPVTAQLGSELLLRRNERRLVFFYEIALEGHPNAGGRRFSMMFDGCADAENESVLGDFCWVDKFNIFNRQPCSVAGNQRAFGNISGTSTSKPRFFTGLPQSPSEPSDEAGGDRGNSRRNPTKTFSDLPERDKGYVICGAFFVASLVVIAIFYVVRKQS